MSLIIPTQLRCLNFMEYVNNFSLKGLQIISGIVQNSIVMQLKQTLHY